MFRLGVADEHRCWARGQLSSLLPLVSSTDLVDGCLPAWEESLAKEGVLRRQDSPILAAEQNLEGHSARNENSILCICK